MNGVNLFLPDLHIEESERDSQGYKGHKGKLNVGDFPDYQDDEVCGDGKELSYLEF